MRKTVMLIAIVLITALLAAMLVGCAEKAVEGTAPNDILTFSDNTDNRPIIRIGTQYYSPDDTLIKVLQEKYPDYLFVLDYSTAAGAYSERRLIDDISSGKQYYDMLITASLGGSFDEFSQTLVDLSAESFLDNYLLTSLNSVSVDGRIFFVPGTSTLSGIAFNAGMFREHGWEIPETIDDFFALCEQISAAGIKPFSACFKYENAVNRLLTLMNYSNVFANSEGIVKLREFQTVNGHYSGFFEPVFELAKRFSDTGVLGLDIFTASLTKQRQAFWNGEYAMIDYDSTIFSYKESENADIDLGIMPYPSLIKGNAGFSITPEYYFSIPKVVQNDPERFAFIKEIFAFISTQQGQDAMLADSLRISNVMGISLADNEASKYAEEAYRKGNLYPLIAYEIPGIYGLNKALVFDLFNGASVDEVIANGDRAFVELATAVPEVSEEVKIAEATAGFTMLETTYYIADEFKELTGADIGMMINGGFFRSNLATIEAGDITDNVNRFVMKGVGANDFLNVYTLTGAQIKNLLEYPIVNDNDVDALIASSGLKIEYAPWNKRGSRVVSLCFEDGGELKDDEKYTVAAWAGAIDERYITATVRSCADFGSISEIMLNALSTDKTISPNISGRVKLIWPS